MQPPLSRETMTMWPADPDVSHSALLLDLVRRGMASTRPQLVAESGLGRKAVTQRVGQLLEVGLLEETGLAPSGGGRQPRTLSVNPKAGTVLAALIGSTELTVASIDTAGTITSVEQEVWRLEEGPEPTMRRLASLLRRQERASSQRPWAVAVGVPGPVEFSTGRIVAPSVMPGWDGFNPRMWLRNRIDAPVWVDNQVHLMALAEWHAGGGSGRDMLFVEAGVNVGAGVVSGGRVLRGDRGGAGAIGHIRVSEDPGAQCRCGFVGCLEAVVGGWAVQARVAAVDSPRPDAPMQTLEEIGKRAREGDEAVLRVLRDASSALGSVIADLVNFLNPGEVVLGGGILRTGEEPIDVLARTITRRGTPLSTERLTVRASSLPYDYGLSGAGRLALDGVLQPDALARWLPAGSPGARAAELQSILI